MILKYAIYNKTIIILLLFKRMENLYNDIGKDLCKFKKNVLDVENIINIIDKDLNGHANFDQLELIEEKIDKMIYKYQFIKEKFNKTRLLSYEIENNEKNKINEN